MDPNVLNDSSPLTPVKPAPIVIEDGKDEKDEDEDGSKKKKLALIIGLSVGIVAIVGVLLYFLVFKKKAEPEIVLSDAQYLVEVKAWEKQDAPTVIWTFESDGTGEITTNKNNYYKTTWGLAPNESGGQTLEIVTEWLYKLNDSFNFSLNRDEKTFTVKNLNDETESVFVPLGTQETAPEETPAELENSQE